MTNVYSKIRSFAVSKHSNNFGFFERELESLLKMFGCRLRLCTLKCCVPSPTTFPFGCFPEKKKLLPFCLEVSVCTHCLDVKYLNGFDWGFSASHTLEYLSQPCFFRKGEKEKKNQLRVSSWSCRALVFLSRAICMNEVLGFPVIPK